MNRSKKHIKERIKREALQYWINYRNEFPTWKMLKGCMW